MALLDLSLIHIYPLYLGYVFPPPQSPFPYVGPWILPKVTLSRTKRSLPVPTLLLRTPTLHYPHYKITIPKSHSSLPHFNYNKITSSIININISLKTLHIFSLFHLTTVSTSILLKFYYITSQHYIISKQYYSLYYHFNFNFNLDLSLIHI